MIDFSLLLINKNGGLIPELLLCSSDQVMLKCGIYVCVCVCLCIGIQLMIKSCSSLYWDAMLRALHSGQLFVLIALMVFFFSLIFFLLNNFVA